MFGELATNLVQELGSVGILTPSQIAKITPYLERHPNLSASELGTELVRKKLATRFQIDEILAGRTARLTRGKYILLDRIRTSAMGVVYRALHPDLKCDVVLKELPADVLAAGVAAERFRREVQILAKLRNSHIVAVFDASLDSTPPYLVMEFVPGLNLQELVQKQGPLPLPQALRLTIEAARALVVVHEHGLVHRDIKPSNLMYTQAGEVKLIDFGLARVASSSGTDPSDLTGNFFTGTPEYMSPEQCGSKHPVDQRSDIYSLGCTLYFLLAGEPPLTAGSLAEKIAWHQSGPIPSLLALAPYAPPVVDEIFQKMLARDATQRWKSAQELLAALQPVVAELSTAPQETIPLGVLGAENVATDTQGKGDATPPGSFTFSLDTHKPGKAATVNQKHKGNRRTWLVGGGIAAVVAIGLVVGCLIWFSGNPEPAIKPTASNDGKTPAGEKKKRMKQGAKVAETISGEDFKFEITPNNLLPADPTANTAAAQEPRGNASESNRPGMIPDELLPKNIRWNAAVKEKVDPAFKKGSERGAGRVIYSDLDTAIEQDLDGVWTVGSALTKDGAFWQFTLENGEITASPLSAEVVALDQIEPDAIQRVIDDRFEIRAQPIISFEAADLAIEPVGAGEQRLTISLLCKQKNDVVFDTAQLVVDVEAPGQENEPLIKTATHHITVQWTSPPSGWQLIEKVIKAERTIHPGSKIRIHMNAFVYQPRPSYYRISNQFQMEWYPKKK